MADTKFKYNNKHVFHLGQIPLITQEIEKALRSFRCVFPFSMNLNGVCNTYLLELYGKEITLITIKKETFQCETGI